MLFLIAVNLLLMRFIHNVSSSPCLTKGICEGVGSVSGSFSESVKASASSASSSFESSTSMISSGTSGTCSSSFDEAYWSGIFEKCKFISDVERSCYLKWLTTFSDDKLAYYKKIADYLTIQEALSSDILDYVSLKNDIMTAYEFLNTNGIFSVDIELASKTDLLKEYTSKLSTTLKCLAPNTPLYELLSFSVQSDVDSLPCTIGFLYSIVQNQETFFASSTTSSSSSTRSTATTSSSTKSVTSGSSVSLTEYESILQAASIEATEYQQYLSFLSKLSSDQMCLFTDLINFLNKDTQVLTAKMILDYQALSQEITNIYQSLVTEQFFVENANWAAKEAVLSGIKSKLSTALGYLGQDCSMYRALSYCLEQNLSAVPLFVGLSNYLLLQQGSYFSASSSSSSTVSQSSCSSSSSSTVCAK